MQYTLFKKYDIRGVVGKEFTPDDVPAITQGILAHLLSITPTLSTLAVGMDGRTHSPEIKRRVVETCLEAGFNVFDLGLCPTPVLSHTLFSTEVSSGIMVTASHNPKEYNGLKIFHGRHPVWGKDLEAIGNSVRSCSFSLPKPQRPGRLIVYDSISSYVACIRRKFLHLVQLDFPMVFDCAHGAAGAVMPLLVEAMEWPKVTLLNARIDGTFPAHEPDPTVPESTGDLVRALKDHGALLGIGFDGDADRMAPTMPTGEPVLGDRLLALFCQPVLESHPQSTVVFDVKCSRVVSEMVKRAGGAPLMSPTGHAHVRTAMEQSGAPLGGEMSCHFFFNDRYFGYDDGIYSALRLLEIIKMRKKSLETLLSELPTCVATQEIRLPYHSAEECDRILSRIHVFFARKREVTLITIDGIRVETPHGWGLMRASNTQPHITLRFEADTQEHLLAIQQEFMQALSGSISETLLKEFLEASQHAQDRA